MTTCDYLDRGRTAADPAAALADPHVAGCPACRGHAASMAWIADAVPRLAEGHEPPVGWQARVLAALAAEPAPPRRSPWWVAAPALAMAAAIALYVVVGDGGSVRPLELAIDIRPGATVTRGDAAIGDLVVITGDGGEGHRALWLYREGNALALACPGAAACGGSDERVTASFTADSAGRYDVVFLTSRSPIPAPTDSLDASVAAARRAGADFRLGRVVVR